MKRTRRRALSILLSAAMVLSLSCVGAFAADTTLVITDVTTDKTTTTSAATHVTAVTYTENGEEKTVESKIFPSYVFVKMVMTDETWYLVRNTRGCTGFLGQDKSGGSKPIPLTEEEIIAMGVEKREIEVNYAAGDSVRVIDGPLAGFIGVVSSVEPDKNKVDVTVSMFGRETPVELELDQVETLDE